MNHAVSKGSRILILRLQPVKSTKSASATWNFTKWCQINMAAHDVNSVKPTFSTVKLVSKQY